MDVINKDRLSVLEAMFDVVNESTEWAYNTTENRYGYYIEGVVAMTERLLREIDQRPIGENEGSGLCGELSCISDEVSDIDKAIASITNAKLGE